MKIKPLTVVNFIAAIVGVLMPIVLSAYVTRQEAINTERDRALFYAQDVLARTEAVTDQIDAGIKKLVAAEDGDPCSASNQALMKRIDLPVI